MIIILSKTFLDQIKIIFFQRNDLDLRSHRPFFAPKVPLFRVKMSISILREKMI
jgi:hypothetical protein